MNSVRARVGYPVVLAAVVLLATAAPAGATTGVIAADKFKWFYWLGFILTASLVLWLIATMIGYYLRVIRPKHRGRETS